MSAIGRQVLLSLEKRWTLRAQVARQEPHILLSHSREERQFLIFHGYVRSDGKKAREVRNIVSLNSEQILTENGYPSTHLRGLSQMPPSSKTDRKQIYQKVLSRLCERPEFAIEEIRESHGNEHPQVTRLIVAELVRQGTLQQVETDGGKRFRWKGDPQQFDVDPWVNAQVHGTQMTESPLSERPRERLLLHGASQLKLSELLAILIRTGRVGESALQAGERIANRLGDRLETLPGLGRKELKEYSIAVNEPAYCQIMAGIELGRRVAAAMDNGFRDRVRITSPATAMRFCLERFERLAKEAKQEEFHMVTLDTKNQPIASHQITVGTLRNSLVHPREVFRPAIRDAANCILVVHNHPSGDPTPSDQDISVTERLESAAEIIGIPLIDHIVVAGEKALSIQEWRSGNRR